ncbi:hypothetical protein AMECASPLE_034549 [Ameca splendens]|uniref:Uncharacterized protein n=1 Tax=Ameca splendens TaxID=208324 RepID=A0ABV0XW53_9TELE
MDRNRVDDWNKRCQARDNQRQKPDARNKVDNQNPNGPTGSRQRHKSKKLGKVKNKDHAGKNAGYLLTQRLSKIWHRLLVRVSINQGRHRCMACHRLHREQQPPGASHELIAARETG